jgi:acetyltransferase-like isoleucine patch superfamily enzyme
MKVKIVKVLKYIKKKYFYYLNLLRKIDLPSDITINGYTVFTRNTRVGSNCHFNGLLVRGSGLVVIGNNFHSGDGCLFITETHNYEGTHLPYDETNIVKNIHIGNNVWLGSNVTILGGVNIGEGVIIQAGSVVVSDIEECKIAGGHPAKIFSERNLVAYKQRVLDKMYY